MTLVLHAEAHVTPILPGGAEIEPRQDRGTLTWATSQAHEVTAAVSNPAFEKAAKFPNELLTQVTQIKDQLKTGLNVDVPSWTTR